MINQHIEFQQEEREIQVNSNADENLQNPQQVDKI